MTKYDKKTDRQTDKAEHNATKNKEQDYAGNDFFVHCHCLSVLV